MPTLAHRLGLGWLLGDIVPVVRLEGRIAAGRSPGAISLQGTAAALERAFKLPRLKAVAVVVNSPGGSAAQSHLIATRLRALADERKVPVLAFVEDAAASGGYLAACAADEIYADPFSVVGSVGVIHSSFGLDRFIEKHGVSRRVHTAGTAKAQLDPFRPEDPRDVEKLHRTLDDMHAAFKAFVKQRRGDKLRAADDVLFNGDYWTGARAKELGLVDGVGDARSVLRAKFGRDVRILPLPLRGPFGLMPAEGVLASVADAVRDRAVSSGGAFEARESFAARR